MLGQLLKTSSHWVVVRNTHLLSSSLSEGRLSSLFGDILFLGDTVRIVFVGELRVTWVLIVTIKWITYSLGLGSLKQSAGLGTENGLGVQAVRLHLVRAAGNIGENTETLGRGLRTSDIL